MGGVFFLSYVINQLSPRAAIPSFVWVVFAGIALHPVLFFFSKNLEGLKIITEIFAALILFTSGLEIAFGKFKRWFFPIASLSLIGVIFSSIILAFALSLVMKLLGLYREEYLISIVLLSTALASTDPTAILPTLRDLRFKRSFIKELAISESALTDISGSIFTRFLLLAFTSTAVASDNVINYFLPLLRKSTYDAFALEILSGIIVGYFGYFLLKTFYLRRKDNHTVDDDINKTDVSLLLPVPIFTYVLGNLLGGAGFLAAFSAGLFSDVVGTLKKVAHFYDQFLNNLIKPFLFIILGSLVSLNVLLSFSLIGIIAALVFMFLVRPIVVFISLLPWLMKGAFKLEDIIFLNFVRETGIIAAVLLIIISSSGIVQSDLVIALGMWVIILTLVIEPPLTPWFCRRLGLTTKT
ncbi:MAG: cation:proton antiporter [Patescibacteria group bacterium]|nr:cation:proton antiporter [Patescibacteria group bacterium]